MATVSLRKVILKDNWPGVPNPNHGIPKGGFDATTGHSCVTAPIYPPMTKIQAYHEAVAGDGSTTVGPYTMIYLAYHDCSSTLTPLQAADPSSGATPVVAHIDSTAWTNRGHYSDSSDAPYCVANTSGCMEVTSTGMLAIACNKGLNTDSSLTAYKWGWFWCGGVNPHSDLTGLDYDMTTTIVAYNHCQAVSDTGQIVIGVGDASFEGVCGIATKVSA